MYDIFFSWQNKIDCNKLIKIIFLMEKLFLLFKTSLQQIRLLRLYSHMTVSHWSKLRPVMMGEKTERVTRVNIVYWSLYEFINLRILPSISNYSHISGRVLLLRLSLNTSYIWTKALFMLNCMHIFIAYKTVISRVHWKARFVETLFKKILQSMLW